MKSVWYASPNQTYFFIHHKRTKQKQYFQIHIIHGDIFNNIEERKEKRSERKEDTFSTEDEYIYLTKKYTK